MARRVTIHDQTILDAARSVFLERGIEGTTAEVAARAGISEGSVFRRFPTKHQLFRAAMSQGLPTFAWAESIHARIGRGDMKAELTQLALEVVEHLRVIVPIVMLSWSNPSPTGLPSELAQPSPPAIRALRELTSYFEAEMRLGRVRRQDPEIVARTFMGSLWNYAQLEIVFRAQELLPLPVETFVRGFVELLWAGLEPPAQTPPQGRSPHETKK